MPVTRVPPDRASALRRYAAADRAALYDICLRTGDSGDDATSLYTVPSLLGDVYVGPYVAFEPELAFVLDDGTGAGGYTLGALDTRAFEQRCEREWWPGLRRRFPLDGQLDGSADAARGVPHPPSADGTRRGGCRPPVHLHIDLLPTWQDGGWGRRLIERLLVALHEAGSPGVHLGVSTSNPVRWASTAISASPTSMPPATRSSSDARRPPDRESESVPSVGGAGRGRPTDCSCDCGCQMPRIAWILSARANVSRRSGSVEKGPSIFSSLPMR